MLTTRASFLGKRPLRGAFTAVLLAFGVALAALQVWSEGRNGGQTWGRTAPNDFRQGQWLRTCQ